jgi:hypothetical protein
MNRRRLRQLIWQLEMSVRRAQPEPHNGSQSYPVLHHPGAGFLKFEIIHLVLLWHGKQNSAGSQLVL